MKSHEIKTFRKTYTDYNKECAFEGYQLAVLFDEKDEVKKRGGQWDKDNKTWWMPKERLEDNDQQGPGTVRQYLNSCKLIMGQYGEHDSTIVLSDMTAHRGYKLVKTDNIESQIIVKWYEDYDAVEFMTVGMHPSSNKWYKIADARTNWNSLIDEGYNNTKIENNS